MQGGKDRRRDPRYPLKSRVRISWQDGQGFWREVEAQGANLSRNGMSLLVSDPIPPRTNVGIAIPQRDFRSMGSIRYCTRAGLNYQVGIELSAGLPWNWKEFHPSEEDQPALLAS